MAAFSERPKFAPCPCTQPEEDWVLDERVENDGGLDLLVFRCRTCRRTRRASETEHEAETGEVFCP